MNVVPLAEANDSFLFGDKAFQLCSALRYGLPVPNGFAISFPIVQDILLGNPSLKKDLDIILKQLGPVSVRSSVVGEDGKFLSFAGQYTSSLNITTASEIEKAIYAIWESAFSERVVAYKEKMGVIDQAPKVGIIIQKMIPSDVSGIMFTRNPVSGLDERVIEAGWGLGETIVSGKITPDYFRIARNGAVIQKEAGNKLVALRNNANGGTVEVMLPDDLVASLCLNDNQLNQLNSLSERCERVFGHDIDIEWAFYQGNLFLLQCRHITGI